MARPNVVSSPDRMPPDEVQRWLDTVLQRGLAATETEAAELIGKSSDTLTRMKKLGADRTTALACAAVLRHLSPFGGVQAETPATHTYAVSLPVTLTVEIEALEQADAKATAASLFQRQGLGVLTGHAIPLGEPGENAVIRSAVFEGATSKLRIAEVTS